MASDPDLDAYLTRVVRHRVDLRERAFPGDVAE